MNPYQCHGDQTVASRAVPNARYRSGDPKPTVIGALPAKLPQVSHEGAPVDPDATMQGALEYAGTLDADDSPGLQMCIEGLLSKDAIDHLRVGTPARIMLKGPALQHYSWMEGKVVAVEVDRAARSSVAGDCCRVQVLAQSSFFVHGTTHYPLLPGVAVRLAIHAGSRTFHPVMQTVRQWLS